jgi:hypothetical protein
MGTSFVFLKIFARVTVSFLGAGNLGALLADSLAEIAENVWSDWAKGRHEKELKSEIESLLQSSPEEVRGAVNQIVEELAANSPAAAKQALRSYLCRVPDSIRRVSRRPSDLTGLTIPPHLVLRRSSDLLQLLPRKPPRFQPGDRPIPAVDWELAELLGIGGFGEVWKAHHTHFNTYAPVALKFCLDPAARERLLKHEAALCIRVQQQAKHPGIVQLQQTYLSADPPCLQYEYIDGGDLAGLITDWHAMGGPLPYQKAAKLILQLSQTVGFAHRLDPPIVHRDLKPANILLEKTAEGVAIKVADYGIGGLASCSGGESPDAKESSLLNLTNSVRGAYSDLYASPEQMRGQAPDPRDDVHAIGVIWHQMLTGDLASGRPSGSAWKRRLESAGMPNEMTLLLESCFEARNDRPADGFVLAQSLGHFVIQQTTPKVGNDGPGPRNQSAATTTGQKRRAVPSARVGEFAGSSELRRKGRQYNWIGFSIIVLAGIVDRFITGPGAGHEAPGASISYSAMSLGYVSIVFFCLGCGSLAKAKGYSKWNGLWGLANLFGIAVVALMPNRKPRVETEEQARRLHHH